jgi:hypothetical protein
MLQSSRLAASAAEVAVAAAAITAAHAASPVHFVVSDEGLTAQSLGNKTPADFSEDRKRASASEHGSEESDESASKQARVDESDDEGSLA